LASSRLTDADDFISIHRDPSGPPHLRCHGLVVVIGHRGEFTCVDGLRCEDWHEKTAPVSQGGPN